MKPLMSYDGFIMLQDDRKSRDLLNDYFREQGYTVATPERDNKDKNKNKPENLQNHLEDKE